MFGYDKKSKYPPDEIELGLTLNGDYFLKVKGSCGVISRVKDEEIYDRWLQYLIKDESKEMKECREERKEMRKKRPNPPQKRNAKSE